MVIMILMSAAICYLKAKISKIQQSNTQPSDITLDQAYGEVVRENVAAPDVNTQPNISYATVQKL